MQNPPLMLAILVTMALYVVQGGIRVASTVAALSMQISLPTIGLILATYALLPMLFSIPVGRWIDRCHIGAPLLTGSGLALAGCLCPVVFGGVAGLLGAALLAGLGYNIVNIAGQHSVGRLGYPAQRAADFNRLSLCLSAAGLVGPLLVGVVIDHSGHPAAFTTLAGFALLATVLSFCVVKLPRLARKGAGDASGSLGRSTPATPGANAASHVSSLLWQPRLLPVFLVGMVISSGWDLFGFFVPLQGQRLGLSASRVGLILSAFAGASVLVRFCMPWISARLNAWMILCGALLLASLAFAVFPQLSNHAVMVATAMILGMAFGSTQANILLLLHRHTEPGRMAEAIGIRMTLGSVAQILTPMLFSHASQVVGAMPVFMLMAALCIACAALAWQQGRQAA